MRFLSLVSTSESEFLNHKFLNPVVTCTARQAIKKCKELAESLTFLKTFGSEGPEIS